MRLPYKKEHFKFVVVPLSVLKELTSDAAILLGYLVYRANHYGKFVLKSRLEIVEALAFSRHRVSASLKELETKEFITLEYTDDVFSPKRRLAGTVNTTKLLNVNYNEIFRYDGDKSDDERLLEVYLRKLKERGNKSRQ